MTEEELSVRLNELRAASPSPSSQTRRTGRDYRRYMTRKSDIRLYHIVTQNVVPHIGYVESIGYFDGSRYHIEYTGQYVKRASRSGCQRWMKRETGGRMRRYAGSVTKGNFYRRLVDYWNTLY